MLYGQPVIFFLFSLMHLLKHLISLYSLYISPPFSLPITVVVHIVWSVGKPPVIYLYIILAKVAVTGKGKQ